MQVTYIVSGVVRHCIALLSVSVIHAVVPDVQLVRLTVCLVLDAGCGDAEAVLVVLIRLCERKKGRKIIIKIMSTYMR